LLGAAAVAASAVVGITAWPAQAATNTPVAGLTVSPSSVAVGTPAVVSATATNTGSRGMGQVALGVLTPLGGTNIVTPTNGQCRQTVVTGKRLVYCLISSLGAGRTATLSFTVVAGSPGSVLFSSYARNVATMNETGAIATLTVS
jgi:hypothetical protein